MAAWFWLISWGLWWLIVSLGAKGATPVIGLIGILALPGLFRKRPDFSPDVLVLIVFLVWLVVCSLRNGEGVDQIITWDPSENNYSVNSPALRLTLSALLAVFAFWWLHQLDDKMYSRGRMTARVSVVIIGMLSMIAAIAWPLIEQIAYDLTLDVTDVTLDLMRGNNITVMSLPLFLALLPFRKPVIVIPLALATGLIMAVVSYHVDGQAAMLALAGIAIVCAGGYAIGRSIFRVLGIGTAIVLVAAPALFTGVLAASNTMDREQLPLSFEARLRSYEYTLDKIQDRWLTGWGVEASKDWNETAELNVRGEIFQFPIIPDHPHNMALHAWAETGLIGVLLLAICSILLGERLYRTAAPYRANQLAGASIWVGVITYGLFSYSLLNDSFWMGVVMLASGVLIVARTERQGQTA